MRPESIKQPVTGSHQRKLKMISVLRSINIPELVGYPFFGERKPAFFETAVLERRADELFDDRPRLRDASFKAVRRVTVEAGSGGRDGQFSLAD